MNEGSSREPAPSGQPAPNADRAPSGSVPLSGELRPALYPFLFQRVAPGAAIVLLITAIAVIASLVADLGIAQSGAVALAGVLLAGLWPQAANPTLFFPRME